MTIRPLDETAQWATMLLLNRGPSSMTTLEEALVLREMVATGLLQTEIAALCARHKAWVNRRIGPVDRLHPELVEAMRLGLLHPGSARRLLSLPPGNQLEAAAAVQKAGLGPRDTELLVGLWRRTTEPAARRSLLSSPRASLSTQVVAARHIVALYREMHDALDEYRALLPPACAATGTDHEIPF